MVTLGEIRNEFNLHYDNIISGGAPGINDYELSLYLTKAYREVVYNAYSGNSKNEAVDETERVKSLLRPITKTITLASEHFTVLEPLTANLVHTKVALNDTIWFILKSNIKMGTSTVVVDPILHDEFWLLVDNPYKQPNKFRAWRLDEAGSTPGTHALLIISSNSITSFTCTYIEKPTPIILSNLTTVMDGLSIDGVTAATLPDIIKKNPWLTSTVINRAVELATRDYKENNLNNQISLNARVE